MAVYIPNLSLTSTPSHILLSNFVQFTVKSQWITLSLHYSRPLWDATSFYGVSKPSKPSIIVVHILKLLGKIHRHI